MARGKKTGATKLEFVYITYIATTLPKLWKALTSPALFRKYFFGRRLKSTWKVGSTVEYVLPDGQVDVYGKVLEFKPPRRLSYTFLANLPGLKKRQPTRVRFTLEPAFSAVKLILRHDQLIPSDMEKKTDTLAGLNNGWPAILSGLKSVLETGKPCLKFDEIPVANKKKTLRSK